MCRVDYRLAVGGPGGLFIFDKPQEMLPALQLRYIDTFGFDLPKSAPLSTSDPWTSSVPSVPWEAWGVWGGGPAQGMRKVGVNVERSTPLDQQ